MTESRPAPAKPEMISQMAARISMAAPKMSRFVRVAGSTEPACQNRRYRDRVPFDNTRAKALAAVSEAESEVKQLESQLSSAQTKLKLIQAGDDAVDKVTSIPIVKDNTDFLRKRTEAEVSSAQAEVDRIESELATARTKLKWAQRALGTVDGVNQTVSDLQDAARDALVDDGSGSQGPSDATGSPTTSSTDSDGAAQPGDAKA